MLGKRASLLGPLWLVQCIHNPCAVDIWWTGFYSCRYLLFCDCLHLIRRASPYYWCTGALPSCTTLRCLALIDGRRTRHLHAQWHSISSFEPIRASTLKYQLTGTPFLCFRHTDDQSQRWCGRKDLNFHEGFEASQRPHRCASTNFATTAILFINWTSKPKPRSKVVRSEGLEPSTTGT